MNSSHAALCSSAEWAAHIAENVLPEAIGELSLGDDVLEIGPGYGASMARLAGGDHPVRTLTVVEVDPDLAGDLADRFPHAEVVVGSGADLPFGPGRFTAVVCFTMLHHVQTAELQDELFAEARRVLADGGVFAGSDSIANGDLRGFHADDTYVPVDPDLLPERLEHAGFTDIEVRRHESDEWFTFLARPALGATNTTTHERSHR
jgi:SAM-dependent methyltransferase